MSIRGTGLSCTTPPMKKMLLRLLFRWIDPLPETEYDEETMNKWLASNWQHPGFQMYIERRGKKMVRELSGGMSLMERKHDDYVRLIGQRFENLNLARLSKQAFENSKK